MIRRKEYEVNRPEDFFVGDLNVSLDDYYIPDCDGRYHLKGSFVDYRMLRRLDEIAAKWGGGDLGSMLARYAAEGTEAGKRSRAADIYERFGYPTQEEYDELVKLHADICQARGAMMDPAERAALLVKKQAGALSESEADNAITTAEMRARDRASKRALDTMSQLTRLVNALNDNREVMMSDDEKAEAVGRWQRQRDFERAKREMNETADELTRKGDALGAVSLRGQYPEFS